MQDNIFIWSRDAQGFTDLAGYLSSWILCGYWIGIQLSQKPDTYWGTVQCTLYTTRTYILVLFLQFVFTQKTNMVGENTALLSLLNYALFYIQAFSRRSKFLASV